MKEQIELYTTKTCVYCPSVKKYLKSKGKDYIEIDITEDVKLIKPASDISGVFTVPQTKKGDTVVVGLNYMKLSKL